MIWDRSRTVLLKTQGTFIEDGLAKDGTNVTFVKDTINIKVIKWSKKWLTRAFE